MHNSSYICSSFGEADAVALAELALSFRRPPAALLLLRLNDLLLLFAEFGSANKTENTSF